MSEKEPFSSNLFEPSLQQTNEPIYKHGKPWKPYSQIWVAFFGGTLALGAIAYLNGRRLAMTQSKQLQMIAIIIMGIFVTFIGSFLLAQYGLTERIHLRLFSRVTALLTFLGVQYSQKSAIRVYNYYNKTSNYYDSLLGPGFVAVMVLGTIQNVIVASITTGFDLS